MRLRGDLPGGRRELRLRVGSLSVVVVEIPGTSLSPLEWCDIMRARGSYPAMWGEHGWESHGDDPLDGRHPSSCYRAWHYCASVSDGDEAEPAKLVVMRKVSLAPSRLSPEQRSDPGALLPVDLRLWRVRTGGGSVPLWTALGACARALAPRDERAEFRIASMGRIATYPYAEPKRTVRERERTAIAFAAIQVLAAHGDPHLIYLWSLCPELRDRVVGVRGLDGVYVAPDFRPTEQVLGLPAGSVSLDNGLPEVREHKALFPGYFIDNDDAARLVASLLDEGLIAVRDLRSTIGRLVAQESRASGCVPLLAELLATADAPDHRRLAEILTRPRLFKYLIPVIAGELPLSGMSGAEFRERLLHETGDGPFSAAVSPAAWASSARAVLEAAEDKYAAGRPEHLELVFGQRDWPETPLAHLPASGRLASTPD